MMNSDFTILTDELWKKLHGLSKEDNPNWYLSRPYCHFGQYENDPSKNRHNKCVPRNKKIPPHVPATRDIFFPYNKERFCLKDKPVAYLAETVTSRCEVIEELRSKESKLAGDWENYSSNGNYRGYNRSFFISEQCTLLDLRNPKMLFREKDKKGKPITTGTPFSKMIMELFSQEFCNYYFELIALSDERVYPLTQGIANKAYQHSFNGIAYTSARQPKNRPIYLSNCFVIFEKKFIIPFENLPEDQRQRRCELKAPWDICNSSFWDDLRNEPLS